MQENLYTSNSSGNMSSETGTTIALVKLICFFVPLIIFAVCLGNFYQQKAGLNKINEWSRQRFDDFYGLEKDSLDLLFLGSSHSYCTFDPENFDSALGISSFQLGMPSQHPDMSYYTLREALNYQKPAVVVMEVYWDVLNKDFEVKQMDATFQFMRDTALKSEFLKHGFPPNEKAKYSVKAIRYQQDFLSYANKRLTDLIWEKFGIKRTITQFEGEEYYRSKGYIYCDYVMSDQAMEKAKKAIEIDGLNWKFSSVQEGYLKKIVELCNENDIRLIFVTAPISNVSFAKIVDYEVIHDKIRDFAEDNGLNYLDLNLANRDKKLFKDIHFRDGGHLNDAGVKLADEYFIEVFGDIIREAVY